MDAASYAEDGAENGRRLWLFSTIITKARW